MDCPKCGKGTCVLVTAQQKKKVRERRGLFLTIVGAPYFFLRMLWRMLFGRRQKYYTTQEWHCNYCGENTPQKVGE